MKRRMREHGLCTRTAGPAHRPGFTYTRAAESGGGEKDGYSEIGFEGEIDFERGERGLDGWIDGWREREREVERESRETVGERGP